MDGIRGKSCCGKLKEALKAIDYVKDVVFRDKFAEVFLDQDMADEKLRDAVERCGDYKVLKIE